VVLIRKSDIIENIEISQKRNTVEELVRNIAKKTKEIFIIFLEVKEDIRKTTKEGPQI